MKIKQICFVMFAIFFVLASVGVAGCIDEDNTINYDTTSTPKMRIFVDSETSVMYFYVEQYYGRGSAMTVLLNSDGTPKLYDPQIHTGKVYFF